MADPPHRRAGSFVAVVTVGLASAVLAAVAGHQPWARGTGDATAGFATLSATVEAGRVPVANALALVVLACWGVLLVTRGRVRRAVAVLGALAAVGTLAAVVVGFASAPEGVREAYAQLGVADPDVGRSPWYWVAALASLLTLATTVLAVRLVPSWPEMGARYDAPAPDPAADPAADPPAGPAPGRPRAAVAAPEDQENLDLWKAIDEGRDPTA